MKRRKFKHTMMQETYDKFRTNPVTDREKLENIKGKSTTGNAYYVGFTLPNEPCCLFPKGSQSYAAWAAGVDNAREYT